MIIENSEDALASDYWSSASADTVLDVMQNNCLQLPECEKAKALVRWGRAQVVRDGDAEDGFKIRCKIESVLKLIRFGEMEQEEFARLCHSDLHEVLSADEKCRIFESICLVDDELLPLHFRCAARTESKWPLALDLPYKVHQNQINDSLVALKSEIQFDVDRCVQLVGIQHLLPSDNPNVEAANFDSFSFQVRKTGSLHILAGGNSADKFLSKGSEFFRVSPKCILSGHTKYSIDFVLPKVIQKSYYLSYVLESENNPVVDQGVTLKVHSQTINANVSQLVFKLV